MNEEQLDRLYQHIAEVVVDTIPEEWSKFYLYGEVVEGAQTAYFYYYPEGSDKPIYSHELTELFTISELEYAEKWHQLVDFIQELWRKSKDNGQESWTNFTMVLDKIGKFKIDFNYDDLSNIDPLERKTIWKYRNLGIMPKSNSGKKYLEKYLSRLE
ncbi:MULTISPECIES: antitoxin YezG family protein [Peribacillus]|uniref:Antitoxin YezG n=1 Tax=Peribacillus simplex TaxID=1478 RepID=A0A9W4PJB2_9BACI|nr:antitoxin YezG family protein [Peribacillus simplex]MDR4926557.1 antitoxin YezG family protein [Peribacillus simplex]WHX93500.1 antitoxin YezG family protein [Peribacillus simplex]CAH0310908.1 putative antitoxin YezG [Peribacillus simplex]